MPILLTTPWDPGNYDSGNTYPRAKIVSLRHEIEEKTLVVYVSFGDVSGSDWVPGAAEKLLPVPITGADYDTLMAEMPGGGETIYQAAKRELYEYLIANNAELAGTIE